MNNIQELIERLKIDVENWEFLPAHVVQNIRQAIGALESMQTPLPEDVEKLLDNPLFANHRECGGECPNKQTADMLERLARENTALIDENVWLQKAQDRIAELGDKLYRSVETNHQLRKEKPGRGNE